MYKDAGGHEELTEAIIGAAMAVHDQLGPGMLEKIYKLALIIELRARGHLVETNRTYPVVYRGHTLGEYIPDILVDGSVVVEVKAIERFAPEHIAQVITYLRLTWCPVGLLMNFNAATIRSGLRRIVRPDLYRRKAAGDVNISQGTTNSTPPRQGEAG